MNIDHKYVHIDWVHCKKFLDLPLWLLEGVPDELDKQLLIVKWLVVDVTVANSERAGLFLDILLEILLPSLQSE